MAHTKRKKWKYKTDNKLRGAYGETDFDTKTIRINKKRHKKTKRKSSYGIAKKDNTLINTIVHEMMHKNHPRMHEKTVRKKTRLKVARMGQMAKRRMYKKFA